MNFEKRAKKSSCVVAEPLRHPHRILDTPRMSLSPRPASGAFSVVSLRRGFLYAGYIALILWAAALPVFAQGTCPSGSCLENPLRFTSLERFIEGFLQAIIMIALPIIVAFLVYAGFLYVFAMGNESKIKKAKDNFLYVIIGTILILGAWVLATLIGATIRQLLG